MTIAATVSFFVVILKVNLLDGGCRILLIYYALAVVVILLDQLTKWLVVKNMQLGERITIIEPYFGLYFTSK